MWLTLGRTTELTLLTGAEVCASATFPLALGLTNLPLQYILDKKIDLHVNLTTHFH